MEKLESTRSNKTDIEQCGAGYQAEQIVNRFLHVENEQPEQILEEILKNVSKEQLPVLKREIVDTLAAHINIPVSKDDSKQIKVVGKVLELLIKDERFPTLYQQFINIVEQYFEEVAHSEALIRERYERPADSDPEFVDEYQKTLAAIRENYEAVAEQVRVQSLLLFPT
ncbi:MAG: hypothetical protein LBQ77_07895 [Treponema sp.]|jgi:hypothetical protein|nr:hypothetical protein [Treponema sp.]